MLESTYNILLVCLSLSLAIAASFTALELTRRVASSSGVAARLWLAGGAFSMGIGIWTMHFIGMLALEMEMPFGYDVPITLLSLFVGMVASAFAIFIAARPSLGAPRLAVAGVALGIGIAGMHYTGMHAMRMQAHIVYDQTIVALSVGIAIIAAIAALKISAGIAVSQHKSLWMHKLSAATVMGIAICGMHYTGMLAASYVPDPELYVDTHLSLPNGFLAGAVGVASLLILTATHLTLFFDYKLGAQALIREKLQMMVDERTQEIERQANDLQNNKKSLESQIRQNRRLSTIVEQATDAICVTNRDRDIEYVNPQFEREFGYSLQEIKGKAARDLGWARSDPQLYEDMHNSAISGNRWSGHLRSESSSGQIMDHDVEVFPIVSENGDVTHYVQIRRDVTERLSLEQQLRQAQKLESIGQLAAGIAHEINTPSQYVGDNTRFLQDAFTDICACLMEVKKPLTDANCSFDRAKIEAAFNAADIDYLLEEIPRAITQSLEGVSRVTKIVSAMKEFSHPAQDMTPVDINQAIQSTATVATNEWKYVANMKFHLDPAMPLVPCMPGEFNQAILAIIVNAAHAIDHVRSDDQALGRISITTNANDKWAEIRIEDTGGGMPDDVKARIFDPFFTTKEVGKGTGQGLSIAHTVIVDKHDGTLDVRTKLGEGTCFIIRLPLEQAALEGSEAAA